MSQQLKVLILEDDVLVAWSLREVLSLTGYQVTGIAATVNDALCLAENTRPDLAVVDVRLAGNRDGIEGAQLLRQQFGISVIFLTGEVDQATARRAASIDVTPGRLFTGLITERGVCAATQAGLSGLFPERVHG